jgi:hypothetical protein
MNKIKHSLIFNKMSVDMNEKSVIKELDCASSSVRGIYNNLLNYSDSIEFQKKKLDIINSEKKLLNIMSDQQKKNYLLKKKLYLVFSPNEDREKILDDLIKEITNKIKSPIRRSTICMSSARRGSIGARQIIDFNKNYQNYEINSTSRIRNKSKPRIIMPDINLHRKTISSIY